VIIGAKWQIKSATLIRLGSQCPPDFKPCQVLPRFKVTRVVCVVTVACVECYEIHFRVVLSLGLRYSRALLTLVWRGKTQHGAMVVDWVQGALLRQ
jgi:hypothetical protein